MGYNTVALFLNDQADICTRQGQRVLDTLIECMRSGRGTDRFGGPGQMQVLPSCHADGQQVIVAGGNRITSLGVVHGLSHEPGDVLRQIAAQHGFALVRKRHPKDQRP